MKTFHVIFHPSERQGKIVEGTTVIEAARQLGVEIESVCGGAGTCGKCRVRVESGFFGEYGITSDRGHVSPFGVLEGKFISEKEQAEGYRLACVAQIRGDVLIFVPEESRAKEKALNKSASDRSFSLDPAVKVHVVDLSPPSLSDPTGDFDRLKRVLSDRHGLSPSLAIDYRALVKLPKTLRQENWRVSAVIWMGEEVLDILPRESGPVFGLAIDVGTTTVAAYLCNLFNGELTATETIINPQVAYGLDVMSRITQVISHPGGLERMHRSLIDGLNSLIQNATRKAAISPNRIYEIIFVGNTAMHHLFLNINPEYLGSSPFPPAVNSPLNIKAKELGLNINPSAYIHVLPVEAGFVGADNVGVLIAEQPYRRNENSLIIDVGTNGELVLGNDERLLSTSCATGPALEGAHITFGMRAAPGAIERIRIDRESLEVVFKVVGQDEWSDRRTVPSARGICGSGIIDGIAELFLKGAVDGNGRFRRDLSSPRLRMTEGLPEFVIAWKEETSIQKDITITQEDVRNVQLAKGALYAGAKLLMKRLGVEKIDRVVLAGAFGSTIDPTNAMVLGMFPDCDLNNVHAVGNAAGDGARMALLNKGLRSEAERIAREVEYLELTVQKDFQEEFMNSLFFPHRKDPFPHLKGILG